MSSISGIGPEKFQTAIVHVLLRLLETYILADDQLLNVARYRELLLGQEDQHIEKRLKALFNVTPPPELVSYVRQCLTGNAALSTTGAKQQVTVPVENAVLQRAVQQHPRHELRCTICGFHFLEADAGSRLAALRNFGAVFASTPEPGRLDDELKPFTYRRLEIDHIVPEEGLGWSDADNLQAACQFCNGGRLIFRRAFEPLSTMVAGALGLYPPSRPHRITRQVVAVARLLISNGTCTTCGISKQDAELTVQLLDQTLSSRLWYVPWNLDVTCYRCHKG